MYPLSTQSSLQRTVKKSKRLLNPKSEKKLNMVVIYKLTGWDAIWDTITGSDDLETLLSGNTFWYLKPVLKEYKSGEGAYCVCSIRFSPTRFYLIAHGCFHISFFKINFISLFVRSFLCCRSIWLLFRCEQIKKGVLCIFIWLLV